MRLLLTLLILHTPLYCCTDFQITADDKTEVVGRSMEFAILFNSEVVLHPQGEKYTTQLSNIPTKPPIETLEAPKNALGNLSALNEAAPSTVPVQTGGLSWTSKYAYLAVNVFGKDIPVVWDERKRAVVWSLVVPRC